MTCPLAIRPRCDQATQTTVEKGILLSLAQQSPQPIAIFTPDFAPVYLNPAGRDLLELPQRGSLRRDLAQYSAKFGTAGGGQRLTGFKLHRYGKWAGEILIQRDDAPSWSLTIEAKVRLVRENNANVGFALIGGKRVASRTKAGVEDLTPRETDILKGLLAGGTSKLIAKNLGISPRTVETHRANVMRKCGARSIADLFRKRMDARV